MKVNVDVEHPAPPAPRVSATCRVWITWNGAARLGPGRVRLLEAIDAQGSITQAAASLGLSYRAAWNRVELLNRLAGELLVDTAVGGSRGGGASLTAAGRAAVRAFNVADTHARQALAGLDAALAQALAEPSPHPHAADRGPQGPEGPGPALRSKAPKAPGPP